MDTSEVIRSVVKWKRSALTPLSIGEFGALGILLLTAQYAISSIAGNAEISPHPNVTIAADSAQTLSPRTPMPVITQLSSVHVDALVNLINRSPSKVLPQPDARQSVAATHIKQSNIEHDDSIARFVFGRNANSPEQASLKFSDSTATGSEANQEYVFKPSLGSYYSRQARANLFEAEQLPSSELGIWNVNKTFALTKKRVKTAVVAPTSSKDKFVIMIDPGHGGTDPGSIGYNGLQEKALTLDIAKRARTMLSDMKNISVLLTRNDDTGMSRKNRVSKVKRSNADMVVSLHLNHLPQTDVNLVETFYAAPHNIRESIEKQRAEESENGMIKTTVIHNRDLSFTNGSRRMAKLMQQRVFDEVVNNNPDTDNAGVKEDTLYILTRSFTPGVLIEMSCLSNIREAQRLADPAYRNKLAAALADGIRDYLNTPEAKSHLGPEV